MRLVVFLAGVLCLTPAYLTAALFDVKAFGARGDGKTDDRVAIMKAIEAATGANGGTVLFPAGTYVTGSVRLRSNIELRFEAGAVIWAVADRTAYEFPEENPSEKYQGSASSHWHNGMFWGDGLENITIDGPGLVDGAALRTDDGDGGDKVIALRLCRNVVLRDFSVLHGGHYAVLLSGATNVTIDNLRIDTGRDGINLDSVKNARLSNLSVNAPHGNAIAINGSYALGLAISSENLTIMNCLLSGLLAIQIGEQSTGDFRNITVANVVFDSMQGVTIATLDGSNIAGMTFSGLSMRNVAGSAISIRISDRLRAPAGTPVGSITGLHFANVQTSGTAAVTIAGLKGHEIARIRMNGIGPLQSLSISYANNFTLGDGDVNGIALDNVRHAMLHHIRVRGKGSLVMDNVEDIAVDHCPPLVDVLIEQAAHREL